MKKVALGILLLVASERACFAQAGRSTDGCQAPYYCPPNCSNPPANSRGLETPRGAYVRSPETGEQSGESTSYGLRGPGLRIPAFSIELPELRLGCLVKYRRNPEMHVEGSRAPWVEGRALEFNQVPRSIEERDRSLEQPREYCVPPVPGCTTATEKHLRDELARKESEIRHMQERFGQLESVVNRLAESREREASMPIRRRTAAPAVVEAGYIEDDYEEEDQRPVASARAKRSTAVPRPSAPIARSTVKRNSVQDEVSEEFQQSNVGYSQIVSEDEVSEQDREGLGVWKGEGSRPASQRRDGSAKRSSR